LGLISKEYRSKFACYSAIFDILEANWVDFYNDKIPKNKRIRSLVEDGYIEPALENNRFLISEFMHSFFPKGVYLEIGVHTGCSLVSAAIGAPEARCIGIDHLKFWNKNGKSEERLNSYLNKYKKKFRLNNIEFIKKEGMVGIKELFRAEPDLKVDLFYYDAEHKYEPQINTVEAMIPHMNENCIICIDDIAVRGITNANVSFVKRNPGFSDSLNIVGRGWGLGFGIIVKGKIG